MSRETAAILRAARERIARPEAWTRGAYWRDVNGQDCAQPDAVCFCALGAIRASGGIDDASPPAKALKAVVRALGYSYVHDWNDDTPTTHADVLAAFDRAIAEQEKVAKRRRERCSVCRLRVPVMFDGRRAYHYATPRTATSVFCAGTGERT